MSATLLVNRPDVRVYHADWRELLEALPRREDGTVCDALIVDPPYSARVHSAYDALARSDADGRHDPSYGSRQVSRSINYAPWSESDARGAARAWSSAARGWVVVFSDDALAGVWRDGFEEAGRCAFAPVPLVEVGSRVRLAGDGPSSWTCWITVARPRDGAWLSRWRESRRARGRGCALPGAYLPRHRSGVEVMGGKSVASMRSIVEDYSEPGELMLDPCCGGGSTLVAGLECGREVVGGDAMLEHAQLSARAVDGMVQRPLLGGAWT